jgi:hypothetical protein
MVSSHTEAADITAWAIYGGSVIIYHLYIALSVRCLSMNVALSVMLVNNPAWAAKMIRTKGSEVASVQCTLLCQIHLLPHADDYL